MTFQTAISQFDSPLEKWLVPLSGRARFISDRSHGSAGARRAVSARPPIPVRSRDAGRPSRAEPIAAGLSPVGSSPPDNHRCSSTPTGAFCQTNTLMRLIQGFIFVVVCPFFGSVGRSAGLTALSLLDGSLTVSRAAQLDPRVGGSP